MNALLGTILQIASVAAIVFGLVCATFILLLSEVGFVALLAAFFAAVIAVRCDARRGGLPIP